MLESWNKGSPTPAFNNAAQVWNHTFFWESMKPNGGGAPTGKLADAINASFGSLDEFKAQFKAAGATQFGSGWAWLVADKAGKLSIDKTPNAVTPVVEGKTPILTMDVRLWLLCFGFCLIWFVCFVCFCFCCCFVVATRRAIIKLARERHVVECARAAVEVAVQAPGKSQGQVGKRRVFFRGLQRAASSAASSLYSPPHTLTLSLAARPRCAPLKHPQRALPPSPPLTLGPSPPQQPHKTKGLGARLLPGRAEPPVR